CSTVVRSLPSRYFVISMSYGSWSRLMRMVSASSVPSKSSVRTRRISLAMFTLFIIRGLCRSHLNIRFRIILDFANIDLRIVFIDLFAFIAIGAEDVPNDVPEQSCYADRWEQRFDDIEHRFSPPEPCPRASPPKAW